MRLDEKARESLEAIDTIRFRIVRLTGASSTTIRATVSPGFAICA